MPHTIQKGCIFCTDCIDLCPVKAIAEGAESAVIDAALCLDCGFCSQVCPLELIVPNPTIASRRIHMDEDQRPKIVEELCVGCGICRRLCLAEAIEGQVKQVHVVVGEKCLQCGICLAKCPKKAIVLEKAHPEDTDPVPTAP